MDIYGVLTDITSGRNIIGTNGNNFIDVSNYTQAQKDAIPAGSVALGGTAIWGQGANFDSRGVINVAGYTAQDTAKQLISMARGTLPSNTSTQPQPVANSSASYSPLNAMTPSVVSLPSDMGTTTAVSPSQNPAGAIAAMGSGMGSGSGALSGLTFDNIIGVFVGLAFITTIMGIFKRR